MRCRRWLSEGLLCLILMLSGGVVSAQFMEPELGECDKAAPGGSDLIQRSMRAYRQDDLFMAERYALRALDMDDKDAHAYYMLGEISIKKKNVLGAEANWSQCLAICPDYRAELQFFLGVILLESGKKERGQELLETYLENPMRDGGFDGEARTVLEESRIRERLMANPVPFNPRIVRGVSTPSDEYLSIISPDGQFCFYTRREMRRPRHAGPGDRQRMVEEFTMSTNGPGGFDKGEALPSPFNESYNEGAPSVTADNRILVFASVTRMSNNYLNGDLFYAIKNGGYWSSIRSVGDHINKPDSWEGQPSISANGDRLYFASNREGGFGGLDIYMCRKQPDGSWGDPVNLGPTINTEEDEKSPFIHSDSRTLYFASKGHPGMGGFDIFYTQQNDRLEFGEPVNIGYPINKPTDELGLFVTLDGTRAYFNSNELRGPGGWDMYEFDLHQSARPQEVALVRGTLRDENQNIVGDADITIKNLSTREIQRVDVDDFTGEYTAVVTLAEDEDVILTVEKDGSAFSSKFVSKENTESGGIVSADLEVAELIVGREYRLNDINFATNSYELDNSAMLIIEEFALYLEDHQNVKVDIQGHTDNVGEDRDNLVLSQNRARVVYQYLMDLGIPASRMTHHGYGESRPVADNSSEEGRAGNRRTIFVITQL